eukprot:754700-Hanusia_phi.AAC.1
MAQGGYAQGGRKEKTDLRLCHALFRLLSAMATNGRERLSASCTLRFEDGGGEGGGGGGGGELSEIPAAAGTDGGRKQLCGKYLPVCPRQVQGRIRTCQLPACPLHFPSLPPCP